jgi:hypothetical protein
MASFDLDSVGEPLQLCPSSFPRGRDIGSASTLLPQMLANMLQQECLANPTSPKEHHEASVMCATIMLCGVKQRLEFWLSTVQRGKRHGPILARRYTRCA